MTKSIFVLLVISFHLLFGVDCLHAETHRILGRIVDKTSSKPIPARIYIQDVSSEQWHYAESSHPTGTAVRYERQRGESIEMHTTLSAHPFVASLPSGTFAITIERGKEYRTLTKTISSSEAGDEITFDLERWADMAELGWYSGDTHVHRSLEDLPNIVLAEDLNVTFPLIYWARDGYEAPEKNDPDFDPTQPVELIEVGPTHVIYPLNTEYEIARFHGEPHKLGAFFILNHKTPFNVGVPPVGNILEQAREEGALFELDKHNWPWSMMLIPVLGIDLYEITNNHIWRTQFYYKDFGLKAPQSMEVEEDEGGFTEWGWIRYGFQNYYLLLNCGFHLRPTAGTASGVHPVPLGFGRVYVHQPEGFSYEGWVRGLNGGKSFVTTGPMLPIEVNGLSPQISIHRNDDQPTVIEIKGSAVSPDLIDRIEVIKNGEVYDSIDPENNLGERGEYNSEIDVRYEVADSCWFAVRCFSKTPEGRIRFGHSSPSFVDYKDRPLPPRRDDIQFLIRRMEEQIERNKILENEDALKEYRQALEGYRDLLEVAR